MAIVWGAQQRKRVVSRDNNISRLHGLYQEVFNGRNIDAADEYVHADMYEHEVFPGFDPGREGFKSLVRAMHAAFPDLYVTVEDMIADRDKVVARVTFRGTHSGDFLGLSASGNRTSIPGIDIVRFSHGKIIEHWGLTDQLALARQAGAAAGEPSIAADTGTSTRRRVAPSGAKPARQTLTGVENL
ncbi:MAG: ester cyclase [SAR202 cluster bacterium]|nr:ester cyclase [SAR202 cluster bacterium]